MVRKNDKVSLGTVHKRKVRGRQICKANLPASNLLSLTSNLSFHSDCLMSFAHSKDFYDKTLYTGS